MSTVLERRLRRAFERLPQPTRDATRHARATALATLPAEQRRGPLAVLVVAAAVAVIIGAGAAALAATGNLHVRLGREQAGRQRVAAHLRVPGGTNGFAVVAAGKLWLATRRGLRIEGMPVSAAELSPRALYAAVGIGTSLVALAPGRRAWTYEAGGRVAAAAWSPDGLKIAYVVRRGGQAQLHLIEGDGDHDRLIDPRVLAAKPSWRSDALAVAYVRAGGRAGVYDLGTGARRVFTTSGCGGPARAVAYAPGKKRLAVAGQSGVALVGRWNRPPLCVGFARVIAINGLAWLAHDTVVTTDTALPGIGDHGAVRRYHFGRTGLSDGGANISSNRLLGVTAAPGRPALAVALASAPGVLEVRLAAPPAPRASGPLRLGRSLLRLHLPARGVSISWR